MKKPINGALRSATLSRDNIRRCNLWSTSGGVAWGRDLACALKSTIRMSSVQAAQKSYLLTAGSPAMIFCTQKCKCRTQHCGHYKFQLSRPPLSLSSPSIKILPRFIMARLQVSAEVIATIIFGLLQLIVGLISIWQQRLYHRINSE